MYFNSDVAWKVFKAGEAGAANDSTEPQAGDLPW